MPTFCVGSPANADNGIGDIAVYIYNLKNLPYTVKININDNTVTITGINSYKDSTTQTVEPMLIGDVNRDNEININPIPLYKDNYKIDNNGTQQIKK